MAESFNKFNETLDKLNRSAIGQTDGIMQMSKTFATSDRYLRIRTTSTHTPIAVIDFEHAAFGIPYHVIAAVSAVVPFATARSKRAESNIDPFVENFHNVVMPAAPTEAYRPRGRLRFLYFNTFTDEFFHRRQPLITSPVHCRCPPAATF